MRHTTVLLLVTLVVVLTSLTGCSYVSGGGFSAPGLTHDDVHRRHVEVLQVDRWQMQDSFDAFFLIDRPGRRNRMMLR
ncbi:MAG: hypothetical protein ABFR90_10775 [Planctomycetota bacterium]